MGKIHLEVQSIINKFSNDKVRLKVLEAGCGSISKVKLQKNTYIVGIDILKKQLQRNSIIDEKILGDIQYYNFQSKVFDIIISWYVLEHLPLPELALNNFSKAIKDDGLIILAIPNVFSLKGLITKYTPHFFHVFVYKHFYKWENAGKDDVGPFKTYLKFSISPPSLKKFAANNGFLVEYFSTTDSLENWVGSSIKKKSKFIYFFIKYLGFLLRIISFGKIGNSELVIILRKQSKKSELNERQYSLRTC